MVEKPLIIIMAATSIVLVVFKPCLAGLATSKLKKVGQEHPESSFLLVMVVEIKQVEGSDGDGEEVGRMNGSLKGRMTEEATRFTKGWKEMTT